MSEQGIAFTDSLTGLKELGHTGVRIPEVGLGTWNYHAGPGPLRKGLESGACFIDTAESYGNETTVREAIRGLRDQVFIATKVSPQHFRGPDIIRSAEQSLRKLGIERIDLLQLHEPNPSIPIAETMSAMEELVNVGKVRFIGVSNFSVSQLQEAQQALSKHRVVSNQVRYSLIDRTIESGLLQYCQTHQVTVIAYSPLGRDFSRIRDCDPDHAIDQLAQQTGKTPAQLVINWCLCRDGVVAIPKSSSLEHVLENCLASGWRLTREQLLLLDKKIRFRRRTRMDMLLRRWTPGFARTIASHAMRALPSALRRRIH